MLCPDNEVTRSKLMAGKACKGGKGKPKGKPAKKPARKPRASEMREKPGLGGSY